MADGEVAKALFLVVRARGFGVSALEPGCSVGFVGDHHTRPLDTLAQQGLRYLEAALIGADEHLDPIAAGRLAHPAGDFAGVGGDPALYLGRADIAVVDCWIAGGVAAAFFFRVETRALIRADREHIEGDRCVLQVFAPDLGHKRDGRAQHDGQPAGRCQRFDDSQRDACLACSARQNYPASRFALGQSAALRARLLLEDADAFRNGFILHIRFALQPFFTIGDRIGCGVRLLLLMQIIGDVDELERFVVDR